MEKHNYPACSCPKTNPHHDYDLDHKNRSCTRCCRHECCSHKCSPHQDCHDRCCCACHCNRCRKNLCDTDFSIRLSGLQDGLNFRLRQLLWCEAEFELDDGNTVKGTIVSVGSNFVEVLVEQDIPLENEKLVEEKIEKIAEVELDKVSSQIHLEEENKLSDENEKRKHKIGISWIFAIDKIENIKVNSSCHCQCKCH